MNQEQSMKSAADDEGQAEEGQQAEVAAQVEVHGHLQTDESDGEAADGNPEQESESLLRRAGRITVGVWLGGGIGFLSILAGMMIWYSAKVAPTVPSNK